MITKKTLFTMLLSLLFGQVTFAASTLTVVDGQGQPVANAVVSFASDSSTNATGVAVMDQVARQFVPRVLIINQGQAVRFPNSDEVRHHVYSFSAIKPFEIKLYKGSDEPPVTYDKPGIGVLGCNIHDNMVGYIYVTDNEVAKITSATGKVVFEESLPATIRVWHADLSLQQTKRIDVDIDPLSDNQMISVELIKKPSPSGKTFGSRKFGKKS